MKWRTLSSHALLIPGFWLAIIGSRPLTLWFYDLGPEGISGDTSINLYVQGGLMLAALIVLSRRELNWSLVILNNKTLFSIYAYFLLSALWSFDPALSAKRLIRDFGTVLMVLVILTETSPFNAATLLFVRCSYLILPFSVLLIKYYPDLGVMYLPYGGTLLVGVTTHKNQLGMDVLIFGLMIIVDLIARRRSTQISFWNTELIERYAIMFMGTWLLIVSNSITALLCFLIGLTVFFSCKLLLRFQNPWHAITVCLTFLAVLFIIDSTFDISGTLISALGRNRTLTGRTNIWALLKERQINPLIGCGFSGFWDSPMGQSVCLDNNWHINQAHNGYLETYLNGGFVGVALLVVFILTGFKKVISDLFARDLFAQTKFMFFVISVIYNWSESGFFSIGKPIWFILLLIMIDYPPLNTLKTVTADNLTDTLNEADATR
ncbi:MAG TPA: O-antigen ligase family protein [Candidatus Paceibacterota bacterium]|nr:O-antigen ligase family protein [Candidatus Paceibacterota bacterium]